MSSLQGLLQLQAEEIAKLSMQDVDTNTITESQIDGIAKAIAPEIIKGFAYGIKSELVKTLKDIVSIGVSNYTPPQINDGKKVSNTNNRPVKLNSKESLKLIENSEKNMSILEKQLSFLESIADFVKVPPTVVVNTPQQAIKEKEEPKKEKEEPPKPSITSFSDLGSAIKEKAWNATKIPAVMAKLEEKKEQAYQKTLQTIVKVFGFAEKQEENNESFEVENNSSDSNDTVQDNSQTTSTVINKEESIEDNRRDDKSLIILTKIEENTRKLSSLGTDKNDSSMLDNAMQAAAPSLIGAFLGKGKGGIKGGRAKGALGMGKGLLGKAGRLLKLGGRLAAPLAVLGSALTLGGDLDDIETAKQTGQITEKEASIKKGGSYGKAAGGIGGMFAGAATGAAVGSVIPVVGTAIGGLIGGAIGYALGEDGGEIVGEKIAEFNSDDTSANSIQPANVNNSSEVVYERSMDDLSSSISQTGNTLSQVIAPISNNSSSNTFVMNSPIRNVEPSITEYYKTRFA